MSKKKILLSSILLLSLAGLTSCGGNKHKKAEDSSSSASSTTQISQPTISESSSATGQSTTSTLSSTSLPSSEAIEYIGPEDTPDVVIQFDLSTETDGNISFNVLITNQSASDNYFVSPEDFQLYVMASDKTITKTLTGVGPDVIIPTESSKTISNLFSDETITQEDLSNSYAIAYGEGPNSHTVYESDTSGKLTLN